MKRLYCAVIFGMASLNISADNKVTWHLASYHADRDIGFNEVNAGIGFETVLNRLIDFEAGFYLNSINNISKYIGVGSKELIINKSISISVSAGIVSGYGGFKPYIAPVVAMHATEKVSVDITFIADYYKAVAFSISYKY